MIENSVTTNLYVMSNSNNPLLVVGDSALDKNILIYSSSNVNLLTAFIELDNLQIGNIILEAYHFTDDYQVRELQDNIYVPSAERAIVDTIHFLDMNYNEGSLIEALQNYSRRVNRDFTKLYEAGEHYGVTKETIDYWIKEADEESDMSMG